MNNTLSKLAAPSKDTNPFPTWLARNKGKWVSWGLIAIVIAYVSFLILAPLTALTFGAFEKGIGAIFDAFNDSLVFMEHTMDQPDRCHCPCHLWYGSSLGVCQTPFSGSWSHQRTH